MVPTHQVRLPQTLARSKQLIARCSTDNKVLGKVNAPDAVEAANEGLPRRLVDAGNHRADKVRAEPLLVQRRRDEVGHGLRRDVALFAQPVHVDFEAEEVGDGGDIGGEARQAQEDVAVLEDLGEVVRDGEGLHAKTEIAGYGDAVLAHHGHTGAAICWGVRGSDMSCDCGRWYLLRRVRTATISCVTQHCHAGCSPWLWMGV
jgi:hypothetical protein